MNKLYKSIIKDKSILSIPSDIVNFDEDYNEIIREMMITANHYNNVLGLSAVQIGFHKRIIIIKNESIWMIMINPSIIYTSLDTHTSTESCLSTNKTAHPTRYDVIKVRYHDQNFHVCEFLTRDLSVVIQHELDHLNGVLI